MRGSERTVAGDEERDGAWFGRHKIMLLVLRFLSALGAELTLREGLGMVPGLSSKREREPMGGRAG